ncbi:MAG TPA: hypothetical protein VIR60_09735 [Gammaproteobacteria bacterium]
MKSYSTVSASGLVMVSILFAGGCATQGERVGDDFASVETVSSSYAHLVNVSLYREDAGVVMHGELKSRRGGRAVIQGHIDIEIILPDGTRQTTHNVTYQRMSVRSRTAHFTYRLAPVLQKGSLVRVVHHAEPDHA